MALFVDLIEQSWMHWKDLNVWEKSHELVLEIYKLTSSFPKTEIYGVTSQIRRSASSIPANIVEGQSRNSTKEYLQFLYNARGSLEETRYFLFLSNDLNYIKESDYDKLEENCVETSKMLNGLVKKLRKE